MNMTLFYIICVCVCICDFVCVCVCVLHIPYYKEYTSFISIGQQVAPQPAVPVIEGGKGREAEGPGCIPVP